MSADQSTPSIRAWFERAVSPGLGTCYRCRRPWKFPATRRVWGERNTTRQLDRDRFWGLVGVEEHATNYKRGSGCFPLCEGCWSALTPTERLPYYQKLWHRWIWTVPLHDHVYMDRLYEDWPKIESAVLRGL